MLCGEGASQRALQHRKAMATRPPHYGNKDFPRFALAFVLSFSHQ
jgi:hypothetical protein